MIVYQSAHIRPLHQKRIRKESGGYLSGTGERVQLTPYWCRRIADQDIEIIEPNDETRESKTKKGARE